MEDGDHTSVACSSRLGLFHRHFLPIKVVLPMYILYRLKLGDQTHITLTKEKLLYMLIAARRLVLLFRAKIVKSSPQSSRSLCTNASCFEADPHIRSYQITSDHIRLDNSHQKTLLTKVNTTAKVTTYY